MYSSASKTTQSDRTGFGRTPLMNPRLGSAAGSTDSVQSKKVELSLDEKVTMLERAKAAPAGSNERFQLLKAITLSDDVIQPIRVTQGMRNIIKKIDFDGNTNSNSSSVVAAEKEKVDYDKQPEYIKLVIKTIEQAKERKKLNSETHAAKLASELKEKVKIDELFTLMEDSVIPALQKLLKDPLRVHEIIRCAPPPNAICMPVEEQEKYLEQLSKLSQNVQFLHESLQSSTPLNVESHLSALEDAVDNFDATLSMVAAEKVKFQKLLELLKAIEKDR